MKISEFTLTLFAWEDLPEVKFLPQYDRSKASTQLGLLTIGTDEGIEGHAFIGSSVMGANIDAASLMQYLKPIVMGQNPLEKERLYWEMCKYAPGTTWRCIGAVDVALWDIAGKMAGLPIYALLGTYRTSVPAYASSSVLPSVADYTEQALKIQANGWHAYKIHPPNPWDKDIEICRSVREAVGEGFRLMLDSVWSYTYPEALRVGHAIEELNFYWFEDPLANDDITGYVKLRQKLDIPLLATELTPGSFHSYAPWLTMQATDFLRGDVALKGGITPLVKIASLAEAFRMNLEIHHGGNSLNNVANLHVMLAIRNSELFEVLLPHEAQKYGLINDIEIDENGMIHAPEGPGLGAEIDFDLIKSKTTNVLS